MEVWGGVGGGWRGGTMQIKFASVIMQPPPTHSPPSPVSQAHAVPWRRANHFKRLRNTAALSSRRRSIHFLFYIFYLNSLLHSCLNLFQSGAVETDLQVAAELYLGGVASCPVHMPTREARGRELSIKSPLQTCGRSRNERQKKKSWTNGQIALIKKSTCDAHRLILTRSLVEPNSLIPTMFVFINFWALSKLMNWNSTLTAAGADSLPSWPLQALIRIAWLTLTHFSLKTGLLF